MSSFVANDAGPLASDPDFDTFCFRVRPQARRLMTLGCKAGRPMWRYATVGEVARATKLHAAEVVRLIGACGWLMEVTKEDGKPISDWFVWEDGE